MGGHEQDGTVVGWHAKSGSFTVPGIRQLVNAQPFSSHLFGITTAGNLVNLVNGETVIATGNVKDAAIQQYHSIALLDDGTVKLWGPLHEGPAAGTQPFPKVLDEDLKEGALIGASRYRAYMVNGQGDLTTWTAGGKTFTEFPKELRNITLITGTAWGAIFETKGGNLQLMVSVSPVKCETISGNPGLTRSGDESVIQFDRKSWNLVFSPARSEQDIHGEIAALKALDGTDLPFLFQKAQEMKVTTSYLLWLSADESAAAE